MPLKVERNGETIDLTPDLVQRDVQTPEGAEVRYDLPVTFAMDFIDPDRVMEYASSLGPLFPLASTETGKHAALIAKTLGSNGHRFNSL